MKRWWLFLLLGCGARAPAPTVAEQRTAVEAQAPETESDWARVGWWRYLDGDATQARTAFTNGAGSPLAALGRARLARDEMDDAAALRESLVAATGDGVVGLIGMAWALESARRVPRGDASAIAPRRVPLADAKHTVRISFLPHLSMRQLRESTPTLKATRVRLLGKWWALDQARPKPDVDGLIATRWPLPAGVQHIELQAAGPVVAWRAGRIVLATPADRFPPGTARFDAPGEGPLLVVWAAERAPSAWRVAAAPRPPTDRAAPPVADRLGARDWLARYLAAELALLDDDVGAFGEALSDPPPTPAFDALRARAAVQDPGRPRREARDLARAAWGKVESLAPTRARYALARLAMPAGEGARAIELLEQVTRAAPQAMRAHRTLARAYLAAGRQPDAERALREAERVAPKPCALLPDRGRLIDNDAITDQRALADAFLACKRPIEAAQRYLNLGLAQAALEAVGARTGDRAATLRVRALIGLGRLADAKSALAQVDDPELARLAADLAWADGEVGPLRALVAERPTESVVLDLVAAFPEWSEFADVRLDTEAAIAEFKAQPPLPGPAVRVLDHSVMLYFKEGRSLRWVHEVLAIRSRDAAETYGEIGVPEDARLLRLYTRKEDGRLLYGEEIPEKETISLPDLESGDFVVAVYVEPGDNGYLYDSGYLSPRVFFRGVDLPTFKQRFEAYAPDAVPPAVQQANGGPEGVPVTLGPRRGLRFEGTKARVWPPEPGSVSAARWLPWIRVGQGVELAEDIAYMRDRTLARRRRTAAFDAWALAKAGEGPPAIRTKRLARAVRESIDDQVGVIDEDATRALASGHGNRALVLSAALEAVAIPHRLLVARQRAHVPSGPFISAADFAYPLIQLADGLLDPGPERAAPGFIPFPVVGGDALHLWPPVGPSTPVALPERRSVGDERHVRVTAHWDEDGTLTGEVVDTLVGQEAIVVGHHLAQLEPEQRPRLLERLLVGSFGATRVIDYTDPTTEDPDGPLVLRYRFESKPGEQLALGLFPVAPGRNYANLSQRTTGLQVVLPTQQTVELRLTSDRDLTAKPRLGSEAHEAFRFELSGEVDDDSVSLTARLDLPGGVIAPADYPGFATWARKVDPRERVQLSRK